MSETSPSLADLLLAGSKGEENWRVDRLKSALRNKTTGVPWGLWKGIFGDRIEGFLESVDVTELLRSAWTKSEEIQKHLEATAASPHAVRVHLVKHTVRSTCTRTLRCLVKGKKILSLPLDVDLTVRLNGVELVIAGGRIASIFPGGCSAKGTLSLDKKVVLERTLAQFNPSGGTAPDPAANGNGQGDHPGGWTPRPQPEFESVPGPLPDSVSKQAYGPLYSVKPLLADHPVQDIQGIGDALGKRLRELGVVTTRDLLERTRSDRGVQELAGRIGVAEATVRDWASMSDLMRVPGVWSQYSELLVKAGVHSVLQLAKQEPADLCGRLVAVNEERKVSPIEPVVADVEQWIAAARTLSLLPGSNPPSRRGWSYGTDSEASFE